MAGEGCRRLWTTRRPRLCLTEDLAAELDWTSQKRCTELPVLAGSGPARPHMQGNWEAADRW